MWTISDTKVTTTNIMAARPSTCWPIVISKWPLCHHTQCWSTTVWLPIQSIATNTDRTKLAPTARMPDSAPPFGSFLPKKRMTTNDNAGSSGMSQAFSEMPASTAWVTASVARNISALHEVDLVEVDADPVAVDEQDDRQSDAHLGGGDGNHEEGEDLPGGVVELGGEGDEVDVHGVEHQLDAHQHEDAVAPRQHAVDAGAEQEGGQQHVLGYGHLSPSGRGRWRRSGQPGGAWTPLRRRRRRSGRSSRRWRWSRSAG